MAMARFLKPTSTNFSNGGRLRNRYRLSGSDIYPKARQYNVCPDPLDMIKNALSDGLCSAIYRDWGWSRLEAAVSVEIKL